MTNMASIHTGTPTVTVTDNRGQPVRTLQFCRSVVGETPELRATCSTFSPAGFNSTHADPRLGAAGLVNGRQTTGLGGAALHSSGADDGDRWRFGDILGRPLWTRDSSASATTYVHDALNRVITIRRRDDDKGSEPIVRERHYYGDSAPAELLPREQAKIANLRGQTVCIWDSAGQQRTAAASLGGLVLSNSRRLLLKSRSEGDWSGDGTKWSAWEATLDSSRYATRLSLDARGRVVTLLDAAGHSRRHVYDVAGRLASQWLTLKGQTERAVICSQSYNAAGQPLQQSQGNGVTVSHQYDPQTRRKIGTTVIRQLDGKTALLQAMTYRYDPVGNLLAVADSAQCTTWFRNQQISPVSTYTYDSLYQLLSATGRENASQKQQSAALPGLLTPLPADSSQYTAYTRTFTYDSGGNLTQIRHSAPKTGNQWTSKLVVSARRNHAANRSIFTAVTADNVDQLFDPCGNQTQLQPGQTLSWNASNQLQQVCSEAGEQREYYGYSGAARVVKVSQQAKLEQKVVYLNGLELRTTRQIEQVKEALQVIQLGSDCCAIRVLHWSEGKPDGVANDSVRYTYGDALGSLQLELDQHADVVSREEYYPYGGTATWAARSQTEASYKARRFSGKERDASGLYYYGHRYYQPWSGRWLSADPTGAADGLNLFSMVRNNPTSNRDEQGLSITVGKEKYKNDAAFKKSAHYRQLAANHPGEPVDRLISHYNTNDHVFLSAAHLADLFAHDLHTSLASDKVSVDQSAQRAYLTRAGWHERLKTISPRDFPLTQRAQAFWKSYPFAAPVTPLANVEQSLSKLSSTAQVSVFRTMNSAEADAILTHNNYEAIGKHLGDYPQALSYFHRDGSGKALLEFPLKPGAHEALFTPAFSAVLDSGDVTSVMAKLAELGGAGAYAKAKKGEGTLAGYIGIKPEEHGVSGFSLSLGDKNSRELFKQFVQTDKVRALHRN